METIMILGAGTYQLPLIQTAQRMGLRVAVVTPPGNYPGIEVADLWLDADTRDFETILSFARREHIAGICTSGTDVAVKSLGYVCDQMGLPGISFDAASKATDKKLMKEAFWEHGVSTAAFRIVRSEQEAIDAAKAIGLPVMVKITDSSGSRGISKVTEMDRIGTAYRESAQSTRNDYVIVEKFIAGLEIGVDGFIDADGQPALILPHGKFVYHTSRTGVPLGHYFPYEESRDVLDAISDQVTRAAQALGLRNCPFNSDVLINDDGVHIIEMGGRTGATCIPELMSIHKGYDWYEKIITAALGQPVSFDSPLAVPCMAKLLVSETTFQVQSIDQSVIDQLQSRGFTVALDVKPGDTVHAMENGTDRFGHIIAANCTEDQLNAAIEEVKNSLTTTA